MGFEVQDKTAVLLFGETDYAGAEVRVKLNLSMRYFLSMEELRLGGDQQLRELFARFGEDVLLSWNIELDGEPTPATGDGLLDQPAEFCLLIIDAWREQVASIPAPLAQPSDNGNKEVDLNLADFSTSA